MKFFQFLNVLGLACLLVMACSEKQPATIGQTDSGEKPAPVAQVQPSGSENQPAPTAQVEQTGNQAPAQSVAATATEPTEIFGYLMQTEKGLAITAGTDTYVVLGKDLSDRIGETVKVTGTVAEFDGGQVINVMTVTPME
jgi:hypothetical protein